MRKFVRHRSQGVPGHMYVSVVRFASGLILGWRWEVACLIGEMCGFRVEFVVLRDGVEALVGKVDK